LKTKELSFWEVQKSAEEPEKKEDKSKSAGECERLNVGAKRDPLFL